MRVRARGCRVDAVWLPCTCRAAAVRVRGRCRARSAPYSAWLPGTGCPSRGKQGMIAAISPADLLAPRLTCGRGVMRMRIAAAVALLALAWALSACGDRAQEEEGQVMDAAKACLHYEELEGMVAQVRPQEANVDLSSLLPPQPPPSPLAPHCQKPKVRLQLKRLWDEYGPRRKAPPAGASATQLEQELRAAALEAERLAARIH